MENGVERGHAQVAQVGDRRAEAAERVGHDRAVAPELHHAGDELEVGAAPGRFPHPPGEFAGLGHPGVIVGGLALGDHVQDRVHESIKPDEQRAT